MRTFQEYLNKIKPHINERIKEITQDKLKDPDIIPMLLKGKRLRAGLLLLVYDSLATKGHDRDIALDLACGIELAHSASLILDDMLDEDIERRGLPTIHLKKGHKKAMLDTIGVLSVPYDIVSQHGKRFVETLAQIQGNMVGGAVRELLHKPDLPATVLYNSIIGNKTGKLFSLAALWGFVAVRCAGCGSLDQYCPFLDEMAAFSNYGLHCGKAMQIADDIADLQKIIEGKKTSGFGSEMLLLRCMNLDRLVKEFFTDVKNLSLDRSKIKELWSQEGVQKTLNSLLDKEINEAKENINEWIKVPYIECEELLINAPREIVDIMLREG